MACFIVPAAEAIVTTVLTRAMRKKEDGKTKTSDVKIKFSHKLKWLSNLLWGGSALLAFEHVWHGEVTPWFPFLTAASNPADAAEMLHEMATAGVAMACLVTAVWIGMVLVTGAMEKKMLKAKPSTN
ncbi:hypothetical protein [Massiliimalia massiliensis]|uniref:hypothetical protein n=1 Tax=Massiliimalia massiliensis TaxID=1852384 RepID=UPI000986F3DB|nr:hypothetical protein [Massiliimalia massiliensis]